MSYIYSAFRLHKSLKGKISVRSKVNLKLKKFLSLAYTPGVGEVVNYIYRKQESVWGLTIKNNTVAVITDGSAVLGLGNVGPFAALPVMEGKCAIFREFADINAFPICLKTQNIDEIVATIINISPVFGGINLEDISAPRCFEIEKRLQKALDIPVMHDDQHATSIVVLAALINACKVVDKELKKCKVVIVGAGAAGTTITKLLNYLNIKNILVVDSQGIISRYRKELPRYKKELVIITNQNNLEGDLQKAAIKADILIGVSKKGLFTKQIIQSMSKNPVVFALANPDPEVTPSNAKKWGVAAYASGRSDYPNQVNNALVFPGFFKGLLKRRVTKITNYMKVKAAYSLASLIKKPSPRYFIPSILDKRVVKVIAESI